MLARLSELQVDPSSQDDVGEVDGGVQRAAGDEVADAGVEPESEGVEVEETKDKPEPESVPMPAFKARIGQLTSKVHRMQGQLAERDHEIALHQEAVKVMQAELQRYRQFAQEGTPIDERDEQIRALQMQQTLRRREQEIADAQVAAREQRAVEEVRSEINGELDEALVANDLVSREALKAAAHADTVAARHTRRSPRAIADIAASLQAKRESDVLARHQVAAPAKAQPQRRPSPATVKGRIGQTSHERPPATKAGFLARLREIEQQNS